MFLIIVLLGLCGQIFARPENIAYKQDDDKYLHPHPKTAVKNLQVNPEENTAEFWNKNAQQTIIDRLKIVPNTNVAKNVILFMGDGMSIPTVSTTRVYLASEEFQLSFDKFPYTALSKTYCVDYQVPDSACTSTAYLGGVKGNLDTIGVTGAVPPDDCIAMTNTSNHVHSIAKWFQNKAKRTGFVTTSRVTHASPAGVYAHTAQRTWECDSDILYSNQDPTVCHDIAHQLVNWETGRQLNVILGGGRTKFLPKEINDPLGNPGQRSDKINLIDQWLTGKINDNQTAQFVWNRDDLLDLNATDYVMGLFNADHMEYNLQRNTSLEPSLEEMTEAAIKLLRNGDQGYFLFVEGARIDMAHHENHARKALDETAEFNKAIQKAVDITDETDTLIVVTADHAHTMSYAGYPVRGNDILGVNGMVTKDGLPYTTLGYANGMGYKPNNQDGSRYDISNDDFTDINYRYPANNPMDSETHGGDDVGIFARGPWSHLYAGVIEENVIPHIMAYASCVGDGVTACDNPKTSSTY